MAVPVQTVSELNRRDHWSERHRRATQQKELTTLLLRSASGFDRRRFFSPYRVTLTRIAPGAIKDSDNLASAMKAVRDGVAKFLGVDDADLGACPDVTWVIAQEKQSSYAVRIDIEACANEDERVL